MAQKPLLLPLLNTMSGKEENRIYTQGRKEKVKQDDNLERVEGVQEK